jgi:hypothetical protein
MSNIKEFYKQFARSRMKMLSDWWFWNPPQSLEARKSMDKEWKRLKRIAK